MIETATTETAFNSPRVLLQLAVFYVLIQVHHYFQFSQSLIATFFCPELGARLLLGTFNSPRVLLQHASIPAKFIILSILLESYCNDVFVGICPEGSNLSILLESYCNNWSRQSRRFFASTFNSPRVLLQHHDAGRPSRAVQNFQFSQSLIATTFHFAIAITLLIFQSPRVLLQPVPPAAIDCELSFLSILLESYCNWTRFLSETTSRILSILLESYCNTRHPGAPLTGENRFQFSQSLIATPSGEETPLTAPLFQFSQSLIATYDCSLNL